MGPGLLPKGYRNGYSELNVIKPKTNQGFAPVYILCLDVAHAQPPQEEPEAAKVTAVAGRVIVIK